MRKSLSQIVHIAALSSFPLIQIALGILPIQSTYAAPNINSLIINDRPIESKKISPTDIAQASPLYGCWQLTFSVSGIVHESVLVMNGYSGNMRTQYFNPGTRSSDAVDQTMKLSSSAQGVLILGHKPVYAGTRRRHPTYSADNFLFQVRPNGTLIAVTCDRKKRCSPVDVMACRR
jgi:hypothetical protein